MTFASLR